MTRSQLLVRGATVLGAGGLGGLAAQPARAASEEDLALIRLGISIELLASAFYRRALDRNLLLGSEVGAAGQAIRHAGEHYDVLAPIVGPTAAVADDFTITFGRRAFATRRSILETGQGLESIFLGSYLGAAAALQDTELRGLAARLAADHSRALGYLGTRAGRAPLGSPFPNPLDVAQAAHALAPYLS